MKKTLILALLLLGGCAARQQRELNNAFEMAQRARSEALIACAASSKVASCMLGVAATFGGGSNSSPQVVQSDLSVILNSSVIGAGLGVVRDIAVAKSGERTQIASINANAATQQAQTAAFVGVATGGFNALTNVSVAGANAQARTAEAGFAANQTGFQQLGAVGTAGFQQLGALGTAGFASQQAIAESAFNTFLNLPPTYSLGDGAVFGNGNLTQNGDGGIDQSQNRDRGVVRTCTASPVLTVGQTGTASGTTGPSATLGLYPQQPVSNDCGG